MMNRPNPMYKRGGLNDEGGEVDEVSGNKVPVGGTKEGVRDDIEVNMSAGEFVSDEATTRYHGLKTFLGMRDEAMMGMQKMEAMGLMGNSDEATLPTDMPFGMADLIVVDVDEKNGKEKEINMQEGGVLLDQTGETISLESQQQDVPTRENIKVTFDEVMSEAKMEFKEYRNAEGQSLMVPFIGGVPLYPIPEGYTLYTGEGSETGETDLPETGAEQITPSAQGDDDDDKDRALAAYRGSKKDTSIQWDTLSDDDFLKEANGRNGFGRNLAMGVASLISPFAAIGMGGLLAMEDKKVLAMARARLANLPTGSAQRAAYEKMIEGYEARGKGLFGGIIGKVVDILGNVLGTSEEAKEKAQNANLLNNSGVIVGKYSSNGQITEEGIEAVNNGIVETFNGGSMTTDQYQQLLKDKDSTDKSISDTAKVALSNYIGNELGSFVNQNLLNTVKAGLDGMTPEQTRLAFVNIAYQPSTVLKDQLDALTPNQQKFLGYTEGVDPATVLAQRQNITAAIQDPNAGLMEVQGAFQDLANLPTSASGTLSNYLDISDEMREQVSRIVPQGAVATQAPARTFMDQDTNATRASFSGDTGVAADNTITTADVARIAVQNANLARQQQVNDLIAVGVPIDLAEKSVPQVNLAAEEERAKAAVTGMYTTPEQTGLEEALESDLISSSSVATDRGFTPSNVAQSAATTTEAVTPMSLGFGDRQGGEFSGVSTSSSAQTPDQMLMVDPASAEKLKNDAAVTAGQQAYATSASPTDPYDPRSIIPDPSQLVRSGTSTGTDTGTGIFSNAITELNKPTDDPYNVGQSGEFAGFGTTPQTQTDRGFDPNATQTTVSTADGSTGARQFQPNVGTFDSKTVQDEMAKQEASYMEAAFGGGAGTSTTPTLADVVPDSGGISTPAGADTMSFDDAFSAARTAEKNQGIASGTGQFEYNGQMYSTATAEEAAAGTTVSKQTEQKGKYNVTANKQLSGGYDTVTLSDAEQGAFDAAVDRGDSNVANHFASVNRLRNKQDEYAASDFDPTVGRSLGLSVNDMAQAEEYGGSVQTAINDGRAEKGDGIFSKVEVTDTSKSKGGSSAGKSSSTSKSSTKSTTKKSDSGSSTKTYNSLAEAAADGQHGKAVTLKSGAVQKVEFADKSYDKKMKDKSTKANKSSGSSKKDSGGSKSETKSSGGGGCCFIMLEARYGDGTMDEVVRRYRDEHMTVRNRRGYYRMAKVLVPLMRKSKVFKWVVAKTFADPLVSYGKYYYGQNKHGVIYSPVKSLWMKIFDVVGGDTEFIRENGEVV